MVKDMLKLKEAENEDGQRKHMQRPDASPTSEIEPGKITNARQSVSVHVGQDESREHEEERDSPVSQGAIEERNSKLA